MFPSFLLFRSALPSEALEEFLSILRPSVSIFPSNTPRRRAPNHVASWPYERSTFSFRPWARIEAAPAKSEVDDSDVARSSQPSRNALSPKPGPATPEIDASLEMEPFIDGEPTPFRWFSSGVLGELIQYLVFFLVDPPLSLFSLPRLAHAYPQPFLPSCYRSVSSSRLAAVACRYTSADSLS